MHVQRDEEAAYPRAFDISSFFAPTFQTSFVLELLFLFEQIFLVSIIPS